MDSTVVAALIAAIVAAIAGCVNFFLTLQRNKQDGITKYRMEWIENVRNIFSTIFGWDYYSQNSEGEFILNSLDSLRNAINKAGLYLNVRDTYDSDILKLCFEYYKKVEQIYFSFIIGKSSKDNNIQLLMALQASEKWKESKRIKNDILRMVRIYLKVEWTRVKVDSSLWKFKYRHYWNPIKGFLPEKALEGFKKDYINIELVEFNTADTNNF